MNVSPDEYRLGGLRWIVLRGPDRKAFRQRPLASVDSSGGTSTPWG